MKRTKRKDLEKMYEKDYLKRGIQIDRCVLYVYRCAVYYVENEKHESEKLK